VDLTTAGTLTLRDQNPYLLIAAGSDSDYNIITNNGYDQDGYVIGYGTGSISTPLSYTLINTFNVTATTNGDPYANLKLYLDAGQLEAIPEPGTWALMLGGLAVLVFFQRRRRAGR